MDFKFQLLLALFALGTVMNLVQTAHLKRNFLTQGQFRFISAVGLIAFLGGAFVAFKGIFPS